MRIVSIKTILSLFVIAFILTACNSPADISGKLEGDVGENRKVYLIEPESLRDVAASYFGIVVDSAVVNTDGSFAFHNLPKSKDPVLLELAIKLPGKAPNYLQNDDPFSSNYMPFVWQAGVPIRITAKLNAFQKSFSIEQPSEFNKALLALRDIKMKAYETFLAKKQWQSGHGSQLLEKEKALFHYQTKLIGFANSTQYLLPALVAFRWVSPDNYYERVPEFLVGLSKKWNQVQPNHPWVKQLCEKSNPSNLPVLIGDVFPNLKFPMLTKDTLSLKDLLDKRLTILDLWASWCAPCRKENREVFVPIWNEFHDQGLQIVAYGLESDETSWKAAIERDGAGLWHQASHLLGDAPPFLKKIRVHTIPANFILNAKGVVIAKNLHGKDLIEFVMAYLQKK